jgi:hypothetical protein
VREIERGSEMERESERVSEKASEASFLFRLGF